MRKKISGLFSSVIFVSLLYAGCVAESTKSPTSIAGQTGSPLCAVAKSCVCEYFENRIILRGTVMRIDGSYIETVVDELFNGINLAEDMIVRDLDGGTHGPNRTADLVTGDVIGGSFEARPPCDGPDNNSVRINDTVLVAYVRGEPYTYPSCIEYKECTEVKCNARWAGGNDSGVIEWPEECENECIKDTYDVCAKHRTEALMAGKLWILSWAAQMHFGADKTVEAEQIDALANPKICLDRFPPQRSRPCDDNNATVAPPGTGKGTTNPAPGGTVTEVNSQGRD
jgi:hypothetical protein